MKLIDKIQIGIKSFLTIVFLYCGIQISHILKNTTSNGYFILMEATNRIFWIILSLYFIYLGISKIFEIINIYKENKQAQTRR